MVVFRAIWIWRSGSLRFLGWHFRCELLGRSGRCNAELAVGPGGARNIIKYGIEEKLGLDVDVREMGTLTAFAGLDSGGVDIYPEVWLPNFDFTRREIRR